MFLGLAHQQAGEVLLIVYQLHMEGIDMHTCSHAACYVLPPCADMKQHFAILSHFTTVHRLGSANVTTACNTITAPSERRM